MCLEYLMWFIQGLINPHTKYLLRPYYWQAYTGN